MVEGVRRPGARFARDAGARREPEPEGRGRTCREARAATRSARSQWFPQVGAGFGPTREGLSSASQFQPQGTGPTNATLWRAQGTVSYEADLFGRVGRNVEASRADQAQSEALFRSVQLALQADVAQNYFELRQLDSD